MGRESPVLTLRTCIKGDYLSAMIALSQSTLADTSDEKQIVELKRLCQTFEELLAGDQALETAVKRGYLDVKVSE